MRSSSAVSAFAVPAVLTASTGKAYGSVGTTFTWRTGAVASICLSPVERHRATTSAVVLLLPWASNGKLLSSHSVLDPLQLWAGSSPNAEIPPASGLWKNQAVGEGTPLRTSCLAIA